MTPNPLNVSNILPEVITIRDSMFRSRLSSSPLGLSSSSNENMLQKIESKRAQFEKIDITNVIFGNGGEGGRKYYTAMNIFDYAIGAFDQNPDITADGFNVGGKIQGRILLPLPIQLMDTLSVVWEKQSFDIIGNVVKAASDIFSPVKLDSFIGNLAKNGLSRASRAAGISFNEFESIFFKSPMYKPLSFVFYISPENETQSLELQKFIRRLKFAMSPSLTPLNTAYTYPKLFQIQFMMDGGESGSTNPNFLYPFKPAVLLDMAINYSPGEKPAFHKNGHTQAIIIQLNFLEVKLWLQSDFA